MSEEVIVSYTVLTEISSLLLFFPRVNTHVVMPHESGSAPRNTAWRDKVGDAGLAISSMASPSVSRMVGTEAVVFSIQFYGKTIGEVGLMDQDLSELDWTKFKSYIVSIAVI